MDHYHVYFGCIRKGGTDCAPTAWIIWERTKQAPGNDPSQRIGQSAWWKRQAANMAARAWFGPKGREFMVRRCRQPGCVPEEAPEEGG